MSFGRTRPHCGRSCCWLVMHQLSDDDVPTAQIAIICNLKEYQVSAYRAVSKVPGFLVDRLNSADVRALYDLYRQWSKTPAEVEGGLPEADTFLTITDARRLIESITGKTTGSIVLQPRRDEDGSNAGLEGNPIIASEPHLSAPATPAPEGLENERSMGELAWAIRRTSGWR